ncbi:MAG: lysophospholipase L1-like esterase [Planctomycetota bacterium]|jgi:lysophospholipase L1-like esterase
MSLSRIAFASVAPLLLLVGSLGSQALAQVAQDPGNPVRVACVGDSITEGTANAEHGLNSWPLIMGRLLESESPGGYEVGNFGRSGATLLKQGSKPYWGQDVYAKGLGFEPHVVVINLGTNDATHANWAAHGDEFEGDYRELIEVYMALETEPRILLSNLTAMYEPHPRFVECVPNRVVVERILGELAAEYGLEIIDFKTPTAGLAKLFPDGLHPNTAGNELMAMAAFEAITGASSPGDPSIRHQAIPGDALVLLRAGVGDAVRLGSWKQGEGHVQGTGAGKALIAGVGIDGGDFHLSARLRMLGQENCAAGFLINGNFFGFEGAAGTVFRNGPQMGGLRLLHRSADLWERDAWIEFEVIRNGDLVWFLVNGFVVDMAAIPGPITRLGFEPNRARMQVSDWAIVGGTSELRPVQLDHRSVGTPWVDLSRRTGLVELVVQPEGLAHAVPDQGPIRSPDGKQLLLILGRTGPSQNAVAMTSEDEGATWSDAFELPASLSGKDYRALYLPNGRLLVSMWDTHQASPTQGDFVAWVGTYEDILNQREGDFTCRLIEGVSPPIAMENAGLSLEANGAIQAMVTPKLGSSLFPLVTRPLMTRVSFTADDLNELLPTRGYQIPLIDLDGEEQRQVIVDREQDQYLGHVTTVLLEDNKTMLAVYPKGHGKGQIIYKRSLDAGLTWSDRLPTPESWATSQEVPTIHRVIDPKTGQKRLIMWSGLYPARLSVSEDDGASWSELEQVGDWGGIVVMGFVERLSNGSYVAMFHDDGRFIGSESRLVSPPVFTLFKTFSHDGGLTWTEPESVWSGSELQLCEPGCFRSPDGKTLAVLLRENSRTRNSFVIFSRDEGETWSAPRELPASLTGDRHTGKYAPDGRLFISFRDTAHQSETQGDWVGWVGTFDDILYGRSGQYRVRLKDNKHSWDTSYPGVEVLPDGTLVATTYGHWDEDEQPYILSTRLRLEELDQKAAALPQKTTLFQQGDNGVHTYRIPALVTTNSGVLIASCDARINNSGDLPNNIDTVIRRSTDGGKTWQPIETIVDWSGSEGTADPCLVVDRETGRIWCAVTWADGVNWRTSRPGYGSDSFHALLVYSDDDGVTWSNPVDVTEPLKDPTWRSLWFSPGSGIQSQSGRLLIPFSAANADGADFSYAAVSDDNGATWSRVGPMGSATNESIIAQLADGTLVCNMRSTQGFNLRAIAKSTDDGETWSALEHHEGLVEPVCQAGLLTVPANLTPDGREWLVFSNPASKSRERLAVKVSFDGGTTWPVERVVHSGPAAYSCLTLLPDGGLGLLYERGDRGSYEGISFASLPFEWLQEPDPKD